MGGKSSKTVVGYKYYVGFQMILAKCIHKVLSISVDSNQAWTGSQVGSGIISINAPNLFGGDTGTDPEGGVVGDVMFQQGIDTQDPDPYLQAQLGADIPASRGVSGFVAHQIYAGNSPYLKQWSAMGERIHIDDDGNEQWYDEKAEISNFQSAVQLAPGGWDYQIQNFSEPNSNWNDFDIPTTGWNTSTNAELPFSSGVSFPDYIWQPKRSNIWIRREVFVSVSNLIMNIRADNGCVVFKDGVQIGSSNITNSDAVGDNSQNPFQLALTAGQNFTLVVKAFSEINAASDSGNIIDIDIDGAVPKDMNPAHMIREALINTEWGYGYDVSDIDDDNFRAVADALYDEQFGLSYFWDDAETDLDDVMEKFEDTVGCAIYVDRSTLKWTIKLIRADYDASTLPVFTMGQEILEVDEFNRPAFMDLYNTEQITYSSNLGDTNPTITLPNPALLLQQGVTKTQQTTYEMICNGALASRVAERDLLADGSPLESGTVYLDYTAETKLLNRGSVCKLTMPLHNMNETVVRVTTISFGDGTTKKIKMSFLADKFALGTTVLIPVTPPIPGSGGVTPTAVLYQRAIEIPYYFLVQQQGQQDTDQQLSDTPELGVFGVAAARPAGGLSADLYVDTGSGYEKAGKCDFCPYGVLSADLPLPGTAGSDTFTLSNYEDLDELEDNHILLIGDEFVSGTHTGNGVFTGVVRGCLDSLPALHLAGASVLGVMDYLDSDEKDYADGETINTKLLTVTTGGTLALATAPALSVAFASRAVKPYPPANVKIAGSYYPATAAGTFSVTWASRNRKQQTGSGAPLGFLDGSVTAGPNTRYTLLFKDSTGTLLVQKDSIGTPTASVALGVTDTVSMELWTVDDNGASTFQFTTSFGYTPTSGVTTNTITADTYTPVDDSTIIDGGQI